MNGCNELYWLIAFRVFCFQRHLLCWIVFIGILLSLLDIYLPNKGHTVSGFLQLQFCHFLHNNSFTRFLHLDWESVSADLWFARNYRFRSYFVSIFSDYSLRTKTFCYSTFWEIILSPRKFLVRPIHSEFSRYILLRPDEVRRSLIIVFFIYVFVYAIWFYVVIQKTMHLPPRCKVIAKRLHGYSPHVVIGEPLCKYIAHSFKYYCTPFQCIYQVTLWLFNVMWINKYYL